MKFQSSDILFEDNHLIIVNKKCGVLVQGDKTGDTPLLELVKSYIKNKYNKTGNVFLGLVNRIDRPVSGIIILSKTSKSLSRMTQLFREKNIKKTYWAIVQKRIKNDKGTLVHFLKKNKRLNKSFAIEEEKKGYLKSILRYKNRYKYNGNINLSYGNMKNSYIGLADYSQKKDFHIKWSHKQDQKANPALNFSANIEAGSSTFHRNNSYNANDYLKNTMSSNITLTRTWNNGFFNNLNLSLRHSQNTSTKK